jgi:hypothetical protein
MAIILNPGLLTSSKNESNSASAPWANTKNPTLETRRPRRNVRVLTTLAIIERGLSLPKPGFIADAEVFYMGIQCCECIFKRLLCFPKLWELVGIYVPSCCGRTGIPPNATFNKGV